MAIRLSAEEEALEATHEINVTPFIDVMLVLLIIFMVAAPLSTVDVNVDLPASTAQLRPDNPLFVTVKPDLSLAVGETPVDRSGLAGALDAQTQGDKEERIFIRADRAVPYGEVMEVMNLLRAAGYLKIGLVGLEEAQASSAGQADQRRPE
jgi:biopolymer transport protein ExbD